MKNIKSEIEKTIKKFMLFSKHNPKDKEMLEALTTLVEEKEGKMKKKTAEDLLLDFTVAFATPKNGKAEWKKRATPDRVWRWIEINLFLTSNRRRGR